MVEKNEAYQFAPVFTQANAAFSQRTIHREFDYLVPLLKPGMSVIDCGCGTGSITVGVAELIAPGQVIGFDNSMQAIEKAQQAAASQGVGNVTFEIADVLSPPYESESFDCAVISGVLAYLTEPQKALAEAFRMLRPGGILAVREQQGAANWFGGTYSPAMETFKEIFQEDWRLRGGSPAVGKDIKTLLKAVGCVQVEAVASLAEVLAPPPTVGNLCLGMLANPDFSARVIARGAATQEQLTQIASDIQHWIEADDSLASMSEVKALGRKPLT